MRFKDKKCVVTGGLGFLGSHIVDQLLKEGADVLVVDNLTTGNIDNLNPLAQFRNLDISDYDSMKSAFIEIDYVFHTAAIARTPWTIYDPRLSNKYNVTGTLNVLEASREFDVKRVVHSSSCILYVPFTPYYVSKLAAEEYVKIYPKLYGLSAVALRYSNMYGKRQSEDGVSPNVFAALRRSKKRFGKLFITGDGEQTRDYVHVTDVVEANILAALSDFCGVVDVCTGVNVTLNECAKYFECPIEYIGERKGDIKHILTNPNQALEAFGFKSTISIAEGIKDVI